MKINDFMALRTVKVLERQDWVNFIYANI